MEEELVWRDAWKILIDASRTMILRGDKDDTTPFDEIKTLQDDKMLLFEKAIAFESLGNKEKARELYIKASDENNGLPVKHWRKRARYFLERLDKGGFMSTDLALNKPFFDLQWDTYFNIHYYSNLDNYIRYLAISSVSRIGSEPAMAIVIFRTCLEIGLWTYYENYVKQINEDYKRKTQKKFDIGLDDLLTLMHDNGILKNKQYKAFDFIRSEGNKAAHPGRLNPGRKPFKYIDDDLIHILDEFNQTMNYLDTIAKTKQ